MDRMVVERCSDRRRTYFIDGKRVSAKVYRERSEECSSFDSHQNIGDRTHMRFYSVGRK